MAGVASANSDSRKLAVPSDTALPATPHTFSLHPFAIDYRSPSLFAKMFSRNAFRFAQPLKQVSYFNDGLFSAGN